MIAFLEPPFDETLAWADSAGLIEQTADGRIRLTTNGRLLSNEIFARLV
jgi:coproporphyrinogen III oxidase-like Fe-S oxidoreductase